MILILNFQTVELIRDQRVSRIRGGFLSLIESLFHHCAPKAPELFSFIDEAADQYVIYATDDGSAVWKCSLIHNKRGPTAAD